MKTQIPVPRFFQRMNLRTLGWFVRFIPSERQRMLVLTVIIGVLCGIAAVGFHIAITKAEQLMIEQAIHARSGWMFWTIAVPVLGGLISGALLYYVVPDARGSGIPQVKVAYEVRGGRMPFRTAIGKFVIGVLQMGTGASLGREGPTVQICAGISSLLGRAAALPRRRLKMLLPVGAAAGIAAAFNAPIAAVTFVIEELMGDLDQAVLTGVIIAAALAAAIERSVLGEHPVFDIPNSYGFHHFSALFLYALLGVAAAVVSVCFNSLLLWLRQRFQRLRALPAWSRPAVGGLVAGTLTIITIYFFQKYEVGGVNGASYDTLSLALSGKLLWHVMLVFGTCKLLATVFSYSSGGAGGLFAPVLCIGGMLGGVFGWLDLNILHNANELGAFALVGMGAVFAGVIRAPITSVLIIFELTDGYELILPLMLANMIAYALARHWQPLSVYEALLEQDGIHLPHGKRPITHALEQVSVAAAMTTQLHTLASNLTVAEAVQAIANTNVSSYPLLDSDGAFLGLVSEARLRRTLAEGGGDRRIQTLIDRRKPLHPDQNLVSAVVMMDQRETRQLAVVERNSPSKLVGMLTMSDIIRAQASAVLNTNEETTAPAFSEIKETLEAQPIFRRMRAFESVMGSNALDEMAVFYHLIELDADDPAVGKPVRSLNLPDGVLLVTVERNRQTIVPRGDTVLQANDRLTLFSDPQHLTEALHHITGQVDRHVMAAFG